MLNDKRFQFRYTPVLQHSEDSWLNKKESLAFADVY